MNRELSVEYLAKQIAATSEESKLESALYTALNCKVITAAIQTLIAINFKVTKLLRFFANRSDINFCPADMALWSMPWNISREMRETGTSWSTLTRTFP